MFPLEALPSRQLYLERKGKEYTQLRGPTEYAQTKERAWKSPDTKADNETFNKVSNVIQHRRIVSQPLAFYH